MPYGEIPDLWPETTSKTGHYVHAFTKVHGVHDHLFHTDTQTISGRCDELGSLCFMASKNRLWSTTSTGRGCDRYPSVDRT